MAPRGTPPEVIDRLGRELGGTVALPHVRRRLAELGVELGRTFSPTETGDFIRAEAAKWAPIIRASGIVLD
jgi:tripartite-type tricarboxylate transporter receptor subunit TctC